MRPISRSCKPQSAQRSFCITDPSLEDNPIVYASKSFLDTTGYTIDEVISKNWNSCKGRRRTRKPQELSKGIKQGDDVTVTILNYRKDGTPFWNQLFVGRSSAASRQARRELGRPDPRGRAAAEARADGAVAYPAEAADAGAGEAWFDVGARAGPARRPRPRGGRCWGAMGGWIEWPIDDGVRREKLRRCRWTRAGRRGGSPTPEPTSAHFFFLPLHVETRKLRADSAPSSPSSSSCPGRRHVSRLWRPFFVLHLTRRFRGLLLGLLLEHGRLVPFVPLLGREAVVPPAAGVLAARAWALARSISLWLPRVIVTYLQSVTGERCTSLSQCRAVEPRLAI